MGWKIELDSDECSYQMIYQLGGEPWCNYVNQLCLIDNCKKKLAPVTHPDLVELESLVIGKK